MELTIEQKRAVALATARQKAAQAQASTQAQPQTAQPQDMSFMAPTLEGMKQGVVKIADLGNLATTGLTAGFINPLAAGVRAPFTDKSFSEELQVLRDRDQAARDRTGGAGTVAEIGGSVLGMGKLMGAGVNASRLIPQGMSGGKALIARMLAGGAEGATFNTATNLGYGRDATDNLGLATVVGGAAPLIGAAGSKAIDLGKAAIGKGNQSRAQKAIYEGLTRSGKSVDDIATDMSQAVDDGQGVYNLADAMGDSGQRMLTGVARSPSDMRQEIAETLLNRQAGQADRLTNTLVEGFDAPMTAAQKTAAMTSVRGSTANANYDAARNSASPVNVDNVIAQIDRRLGPMKGQGVTGDSIDGILEQFRNRLAVPKGDLPSGVTSKTLSEFDRVLGVKQDLGDAIESASRAGKNNQARELRKIYDQLDASLESSSILYRNANDTFRRQSREIESVDTGTQAASGRLRSQDTIPQFNGLSPAEQAAFRTGYVDPMIAKIQGGATGALTDKSRQLMSPKLAEEFQSFAASGKADQLGRRLAREKTMFQTNSAALGGSKTADNLADQADIGGFDPSMIMNVLSGNFKQAALSGVTKAGNFMQGRNSATRDMIAKALLSTGKDAPQQLIQAIQTGKQLTQKQQTIARMLMAAALPMLPQN